MLRDKQSVPMRREYDSPVESWRSSGIEESIQGRVWEEV